MAEERRPVGEVPVAVRPAVAERTDGPFDVRTLGRRTAARSDQAAEAAHQAAHLRERGRPVLDDTPSLRSRRPPARRPARGRTSPSGLPSSGIALAKTTSGADRLPDEPARRLRPGVARRPAARASSRMAATGSEATRGPVGKAGPRLPDELAPSLAVRGDAVDDEEEPVAEPEHAPRVARPAVAVVRGANVVELRLQRGRLEADSETAAPQVRPERLGLALPVDDDGVVERRRAVVLPPLDVRAGAGVAQERLRAAVDDE